MNRHLQESPNKYDSHTNTILSRRFVVSAFLLSLFFSFFVFVNATTTKTENCDEWFELLESFMSTLSVFLNLWIWMSRRINQTCFECYEFDVNIVLILIANCNYKSMLQWVRMSQSNWISILLTYSYSKFHDYLWITKQRFIVDLWSLPNTSSDQYKEHTCSIKFLNVSLVTGAYFDLTVSSLSRSCVSRSFFL